jgi:hypothetical protein
MRVCIVGHSVQGLLLFVLEPQTERRQLPGWYSCSQVIFSFVLGDATPQERSHRGGESCLRVLAYG